MTIREALTEANRYIDTLDAYLLLSSSLTQRHGGTAEFNKSKLLAMSEEQITKEEYELFNALIKRRKNGECVAYIIGKKEFWGLDFFVNKNVLVPRPETEILIEAALQLIESREQRAENNKAKRKIKILDLCTGSGAIAVALKHEIPELEIIATDISLEALEVAKTNADNLLADNNNITFLQGDLYEAIPCSLLSAPCFLIISNPPYIPTNEIKKLSAEVQNEPHLALDGGENGLKIITQIINDAPKYLEKNGHLLLEADPLQMNEIKNLFSKNGFKDIIIYKDLAGLERVIGGKI